MAAGNESALSLQLQIDEIANAIFHLTRSNTELEEALRQEPGDTDFKEAIAENLLALDRKRATVVALRKKLAVITGHKCDDEHADSGPRQTAPAPPNPSGAQSFADMSSASSDVPAFADDMPSVSGMAVAVDHGEAVSLLPMAPAQAVTPVTINDAAADTGAASTDVRADPVEAVRPGISL